MPKPMFYIHQGTTAEQVSEVDGNPIHKVPVVVKKNKGESLLTLKAIAVTEKGLRQYFWDVLCGNAPCVYLKDVKDVPEEVIKGENGLEMALRTVDERTQGNLAPEGYVHPKREPREYVLSEGVTPPSGVRFKYTREDLKMKVLIVDDEVVLPTVLMRMIPNIDKSCEYNFRVAQNGEEGAQAIEEYEPDLVFTDLSMAGGNGVLVINEANRKNTPVVLMTTNQPGDQLYDAAVAAKPTYVLGKPFGIEDVEKAIETVFNPNKDLEEQI